MGLISTINPWAGPTAEVLLVSEPRPLSQRIASHLNSNGITCKVTPSVRRAKHQIVHFLCVESALKSPISKLTAANRVVVSLTSQDISHIDSLRQTGVLDCIRIVADSETTAKKLDATQTSPSSASLESTVIYEGITPAEFMPARINQRLSVRRELGIPSDSVCVGVFAPLNDLEQTLLLETLSQLLLSVGPVCLLGFGSESEIDRRLQNAGIPAIRSTPKVLDELLSCYRALDIYLNISDFGDHRGILRSWAMGVPVASAPTGIATELLHDGLTAAISESITSESLAAVVSELHRDEEFRHGCCQRAHEAVEEYTWPKVLAQYEDFYSQLRYGTTHKHAA